MGKEKGQREKIPKKRKKKETPLLGRNQNKKITPRKLIGVLIILAGIGVFCYPLCVQAYNAYEQKKMIEELRENIAAAQAVMEEGKDIAAKDEGIEPPGGTKPSEGIDSPGGTKPSEGIDSPEGTKPSEGIDFPEGTKPSKGIDPPEGTKPSEGINPPGVTGLAEGLETPTGTGFPAAEQNPIDAAPDGGQENQDSSLEGISGEGQEENPEEGTQEEETKPDRLNGKKVIGLIEIEAISLIYPIVEGAETEDIGVAIGHMSDTAELGAIGNCALAGHRGGYSGPYFKKLDELKTGDEVVITNAKGKEFVYKVTESIVVEPTDVWVAEDTGEGKALLTLITCEENGDKRLVVRCELVP